MTTSRPVAGDVHDATDLLVRQLQPAVHRDWAVRAGTLNWTVRDVVDHLADVGVFFAVHLGAPSMERLRVDARTHADASNSDCLAVAAAAFRLLAATIRAASPTTRGWHFSGPTDASGFAALACNELLVHGWDAAQGLGIEWNVDAELSGRVLAVLFPGPTLADGPWPSLLQANGRRPACVAAPTSPPTTTTQHRLTR